jgi:hypothetical protein
VCEDQKKMEMDWGTKLCEALENSAFCSQGSKEAGTLSQF